MTDILLSERRGGLMVLTMNRPESTADHKEAAAAFVEKRRPVFVGG